MDYEVYQGMMHIIETFEEEMDMERDEFVLVVNPKCPMLDPTETTVIGGVEVITDKKMYKTAVGVIARDELRYIDQIIIDLGLDKPRPGVIELTLESGVEVEVEFLDDDDDEPDPIEMVLCHFCAHPISVFNSADLEFVTCPWCNKETEIDE